jgi:hypothetical protein
MYPREHPIIIIGRKIPLGTAVPDEKHVKMNQIKKKTKIC